MGAGKGGIVLNPWFWVGILLWSALVAGTSWIKATSVCENAAKADYAKQLEDTIKQQRENAVIDMQAAVEAETQRQQVRIEYRDRIVKVEEAINANPSGCFLSDAVRLSVDDAIKSANSKISANAGKLPATKPTGKQ